MAGKLLRVHCDTFAGIGFWHYGVSVGDDRVVHFHHGIRDSDMRILEVPLSEFAGAGDGNVSVVQCDSLEVSEVVSRARGCASSGFGRYDLASNNCEHFARWCVTGRKESLQTREAVSMASNIALQAWKSPLGLATGIANAVAYSRRAA
jgi:hypothetical protein